MFIGVFGVPPLFHEDDCIRGVKTALEIQSGLSQAKMRNSIGVTYEKIVNKNLIILVLV